MRCPDCGSSEVNRIGLYEYECEVCGEVFDVMEADDNENDDNWYPDEDDDDDDE